MVLKLKQLNTFFLGCQFLASERDNLHEDLCLIDPSVISFEGESLLNTPPYGSDEFKDKTNKEILLCFIPNRVDDARVVEGDMGPHFFVWQKLKREAKEKKKEFQSRDYFKAITKVKMLLRV